MNTSENISLLGLNSFGVDARARRLIEWESAHELRDIPFEGRWMVLGGGNNMLFTGDFDGTLVKSAARAIEITGEDGESVSVRAEAGVDWGDFVQWCIARGLWGAENLSGIPGTVGAAPIQNIGAYGTEVKDIIHSVKCFDITTGKTVTLAAEHCGFGYRDSVFKRALRGKAIITAVNFNLSKEARPNLGYAALAEKVEAAGGASLENTSRTVIAIRNSKLPDPRVTGNAGSFFKNPVIDTAAAHRLAAEYPAMPLYPAGKGDHGKTKLAAGWLIEQAGWKGRTEGRVGIHPHQALIVINLGGATGTEIVDFARMVQNDVKSKFGVELETEVNIV
jgi:UDP-N-acetylmuramate dehydrogenase